MWFDVFLFPLRRAQLCTFLADSKKVKQSNSKTDMLEGPETTFGFNEVTGHHGQQKFKQCSRLVGPARALRKLALYTVEFEGCSSKDVGGKYAGAVYDQGPLHRQPKPRPSPSGAKLAHDQAHVPRVSQTCCELWPVACP